MSEADEWSITTSTYHQKIACVETVSCLPVKQKFEGRNLAGKPISFNIYHLALLIWH